MNEARRLKELERESTELRKMLAGSLLDNRLLEVVREKKALCLAHRQAAAQQAVAAAICSPRAVSPALHRSGHSDRFPTGFSLTSPLLLGTLPPHERADSHE